MVELKVRMGPKGQVVIPKIVRNMLKLVPGREIVITIEKDRVSIGREEEDVLEIPEKTSEEAVRRRNGKKFVHNKWEFYEQYEKRAKRAGL